MITTGLIIRVLFWAICASVAVCLEIEVEGKNGWLRNRPAWYQVELPNVTLWKVWSGRPISAYHVLRSVFELMLFHAYFFMGTNWSFTEEVMLLALYRGWRVMRFYQWFVLNPHYSGAFLPENLRRQMNDLWLADYKLDFYAGAILSLLLAGVGALLAHDRQIMINFCLLLSGWAVYCFGLYHLAPWYRRWYQYLHIRTLNTLN